MEENDNVDFIQVCFNLSSNASFGRENASQDSHQHLNPEIRVQVLVWTLIISIISHKSTQDSLTFRSCVKFNVFQDERI